MKPSENKFGWRYRCSICEELVIPGAAMTVHMNAHMMTPEWPGAMSWTRVNEDDVHTAQA